MPPWFQLSGSYYLEDFCERALGGDPHGFAQLTHMELLKDTRVTHWRHEFIVFSLTYQGAEYLLYFEHGWGGDNMIPFAWGSEKNAGDELTFYGLDDEEELERRSYTTSVLTLRFLPSSTTSKFSLRSLARLLRQYQQTHPMYALFSANCWAWSRAIVLSLLTRPDCVESVTMAGRHEDITAAQLQAYIMIEYGAYGSLLLRAIEKGNSDLSGAHYLAVRAWILTYSVIRLLAWLKTLIFGPLSWTIRLRTMMISPDETHDDTGRNITHVVLASDLTDLIPTEPLSSLSLVQPFCQPGRYLYLLSVPVSTVHVRILGVYIFLSGSITDSGGTAAEHLEDMLDSLEWFECGILRRTNLRMVEVADLGCTSLTVHLRPKDAKNRRPYAAVHRFDFSEPLTRALQDGDVIALWAKGHAGRIHQPALGMIKITSRHAQAVTLFEAISALDTISSGWRLFTTLIGMSYKSPLRASSDVFMHIGSLALRLFAYVPMWLNHWCEQWVWDNISAVAKLLIGAVTPIALPETEDGPTVHELPVFLANLFPDGLSGDSPPVASAALRAIELGIPKYRRHEVLFLHVTYQGVDYVLHIVRPSDWRARMREYVSFFFSPHGFTQDTVTIYRSGTLERAERQNSRVVLRVAFSDIASDSASEHKADLRGISLDLLRMKQDYWWYFWLNADTWTWPWSVVKMMMCRLGEAVEAVEVAGHADPVTAKEAMNMLTTKFEGWRQAGRREYGHAKGASYLKDWFFFAHRTRGAVLLASVVVPAFFISLLTREAFR